MDKRKLIFTSLIVLALVVAALSISYALNVAVTEGTSSEYDLSYTFDISDNATWTINVPAGKTKVYDISVTNPYNDIIKYGVVYKLDNPTTMPSNSLVGVLNTTENPSQGNINANSTLEISVAIVNNSSSNMQVTLAIVNGYKNGGDLIIPSGYTLITEDYEIVTNEPNSPDLVQGLIPVVYNTASSKWVKADTTNANNSWYDYNNKLWANAVLVTFTNRSTYQNANPGTTIADSDILAFYVWIPRYKYKVWNINKKIGDESTYAYNAYTEGIDIKWENEKETTGTILCQYNYNVDSANGGIDLSTTTAETCEGYNGEYYTHPAFTFGSNELRGFWISKFEISSSSPTTGYGGGTSTSLTVRSLPNVTSWRNNTLFNFFTVIQNMQASNNIYGLNSSKTNTDSHIINNYEWGAIAYLTNSRYGRCTDEECINLTPNNCSSYVTGIGADSISASSSTTTCNTATNKYNGAKGVLASTTGNITGVYDMSGGAWDFTTGNPSSSSTSYTISVGSSGFSSFLYSDTTKKYFTTYASDQNYNNQAAYNKTRLGDATGENVLTETSLGLGGWYSSYSYFPLTNYWFNRGGSIDSAIGIFSFGSNTGAANISSTTRAVLASLK